MENPSAGDAATSLEVVKQPTKVFRGRPAGHRFQVPEHIACNEELNRAIQDLLPSNYNFEIHKTLLRIERLKATRVALQLPEGLQRFGCSLADIFENYSSMKPQVCYSTLLLFMVINRQNCLFVLGLYPG